MLQVTAQLMDSQTEASREKKRRKRAEMRLQRDIETQKVGRMQNAQNAEAEAVRLFFLLPVSSGFASLKV